MPVILWSIGLDPDDEHDLCRCLSSSKYKIINFTLDSLLYERLEITTPNAIILGNRGGCGEQGLAVIKNIRKKSFKLPIFYIAYNSNESLAIESFRSGVSDYFSVPVSYDEIADSIVKFTTGNGRGRLDTNGDRSDSDGKKNPIVGKSKKISDTVAYLKRISTIDTTVLITGETGTGKELAAEAIHLWSSRADGPFIAVNCAALPESLAESELFGFKKGAFTGAVREGVGKFTDADGGILFLDEISEMAPSIQAKILHAIEKKEVQPLGCSDRKPVDVRIVAATNKEPEELISDGSFREDLYYRINIARVNLPPLRERIDDIPPLIEHAIEILNTRFNKEVLGVSTEVIEVLKGYDWPGNVRELINLIEAAFVNLNSRVITRNDLPGSFLAKIECPQESPEKERQKILRTLMKTKWNKSLAAQKLNWSRMTLYRKIHKHNIIEHREATDYDYSSQSISD